MINVYHVAVIGAGPGGSMAAWKLAERGHRIIVLDKRKEVGFPVQCGEGISRYAIESNDLKLDARWLKQEINGSRVFVPNGKYFLVKGEGYSIDRHIFDRHLSELAEKAGAEIKLETVVKGITRDKHADRWKILTTKGEFMARYVVGADGPLSFVSRWAGISFRPESIIGYQYKFDADYVEKNIDYIFNGKNYLDGKWLDFHYGSSFPDGYVWVFPRGDEYNIGICGSGDLKKSLDKYCKKRGLNPEKKKEVNAGQIPRGKVIPEFVRNNVLIVGDAAGLTNPITKGGIHAALYSGRNAGLTISNAIEKKDDGILMEYERIMRSSPFTNPVMMEYGKLIYGLSDEMASFIGELLYEKNFDEISYFNAFFRMLRKPSFFLMVPRLLKIIKALKISSKYGW